MTNKKTGKKFRPYLVRLRKNNFVNRDDLHKGNQMVQCMLKKTHGKPRHGTKNFK